jgi:hypothetical protein
MVIKDAVKLTVEFLATLFLLQTTDYRSLAFKVVFCCSSSPIAVLGTATILHPGLVALDSRVSPHPPHNQHPENLGLTVAAVPQHMRGGFNTSSPLL